MLFTRTLIATLVCMIFTGCVWFTPSHKLTKKQITALQVSGFQLVNDSWTLNLNNKILFEFDDYKLSEKALPVIQNLSKSLLDVKLNKLRIIGYSDSQGEASYNQQLSLKRAQAVADAFTTSGYKNQHLVILGKGEENPIASNDTEEGRAENRRATIIIEN